MITGKIRDERDLEFRKLASTELESLYLLCKSIELLNQYMLETKKRKKKKISKEIIKFLNRSRKFSEISFNGKKIVDLVCFMVWKMNENKVLKIKEKWLNG